VQSKIVDLATGEYFNIVYKIPVAHVSSVSVEKNERWSSQRFWRGLSHEEHMKEGTIKGTDEEIFIRKTEHGRDGNKHSRVGGLLWVVQ
jgi:hypothetical protein